VRRRIAFSAAALSFLILLALLIWQGSFRISYSPSDRSETIILWAISIVIFLLTVTLGFLLFRAGVKAYIERHRNKEGSRIRSKLLFGALVLTLAPALFFVLFSVYVLNRHLDTWFSRPTKSIEANLQELDNAYKNEAQKRVQAETDWISLLPKTREAAQTGHIDAELFRGISKQRGIRQLILVPEAGVPMLLYQLFEKSGHPLVQASAEITDNGKVLGHITVVSALGGGPAEYGELAAKQDVIQRFVDDQPGKKKVYQDTYFGLICLITIFVLFFASWSAQILSRQISVPISALLGAAQEVRRGNLSYRVRVNAIDELATLVRAFNEMTSELEANARELESRRKFTEAILESIPTGVISVSTDERIERVNRALAGIFSPEVVSSATRLQDLFPPDDLAEIRYLLKRARRTGAAACQLDWRPDRFPSDRLPKDRQRLPSVLHLAVTVASLEEHRGFVMVLEDTSDLLRAQKAIAWQEVARRIAHEIKNPLTPISLCADRIARQLSRLPVPQEARLILEECTQTIRQEVQTVKSLVNEFSQFSRFPSAQPVPIDLNEIVESAMSVFAGRLDGLAVSLNLERHLPLVMADREQMKRVIVNLIDNAAEAMKDSLVRKLLVATSQASPDTVELSVTDTGSGISAADKEKLFLPYFSTKERGTGLGLAIVSRIVTEHHGRVRVEDNYPSGARFIVEVNALPAADVSPPDGYERRPATLKV
jgi:two-component system, NtrC family, nitrogen regulation sensor histidine kinase NtrY